MGKAICHNVGCLYSQSRCIPLLVLVASWSWSLSSFSSTSSSSIESWPTLLAIQFWNLDKYIFGNFWKMQFYMLVIYWCMARFKEQTEENWENNILDKAQFSFLENYDGDCSLVFFFWIYSIKGEYFQFVRILSSTKANFGEVLTHFSTGDSIKPLNENCI